MPEHAQTSPAPCARFPSASGWKKKEGEDRKGAGEVARRGPAAIARFFIFFFMVFISVLGVVASLAMRHWSATAPSICIFCPRAGDAEKKDDKGRRARACALCARARLFVDAAETGGGDVRAGTRKRRWGSFLARPECARPDRGTREHGGGRKTKREREPHTGRDRTKV